MLIAVLGPMGSGKTILLVYLATKSKREVYSNFKIDVENYKPLEIADLLDLKNNIDVYIDEGYTWLESRTSGSTLNRYLSYIILQSRKRTIDIILTAQMFSSIDVRFREQCDIIIKCKKVKKGFKYSILFVAKNVIRHFLLKVKDAKKLYGIYDTYEIVEPHTKEVMLLKLAENKPEVLYEELKEIALKIRKDVKEITHPKVVKALMKNGYRTTYEEQIYLHLKDLEN